jgi:hypothetical protein
MAGCPERLLLFHCCQPVFPGRVLLLFSTLQVIARSLVETIENQAPMRDSGDSWAQ